MIGRFDMELLPPNVRTRRIEENEKWTRYEVVMDVFPDVIAYGLADAAQRYQRRRETPCGRLPAWARRPAARHDRRARISSPTKRSIRGWQNVDSSHFRRRTCTFLAIGFARCSGRPIRIKKTLFSIIVPQHQQIVDWLQTLPQVDPDRVAFYGLSYGGKTAMRVPPLVTDYCLSICSADFNEWVDKNASTRNPHSYANSGEYEIFEFDLGSTFNYAEMAALVAPRPFMVERGHYDGVASDETVGWEYAKVRFLYAAKLKIPDRTEIEWFDGPHTINGVGTYAFLHRHLNWPEPGVTTASTTSQDVDGNAESSDGAQ